MYVINTCVRPCHTTGNNALMKALYEVENTDVYTENLAILARGDVENMSAMWRYRPRITIDHLTQV